MTTNSANRASNEVTASTVVPGLGYPAGRVESSPIATGWPVVSDQEEVKEIVSRETLQP